MRLLATMTIVTALTVMSAVEPAHAQFAAPSGSMDTSSSYQHQLFEHQLERRRHDQRELYRQQLEKQDAARTDASHQEQKLEMQRQTLKHDAARQAFEKAEAARHH